MNITLELDRLNENDLSPDDFVMIKLLASGKYEDLALLKIHPNLKELVDNDWIEPINWETFKSIVEIRLTKKSYDMLQIETSEEIFEEIADTFIKLWDGTKPGTISATQSIIRKLKWFFREYQGFDADIVKTAAAYYVSQQQYNGNYKFLKSIANFIEQDNNSMLYSFCISVQQGDNKDSSLLA